MCPVVPVKPVKNSVHMEPKESNSKPGIPQLTAGTPGSHQPIGGKPKDEALKNTQQQKTKKKKEKRGKYNYSYKPAICL